MQTTVNAAAPTGSSAVMTNSTATTVDIVVTGTDFDTFVSSGTTTANSTDRANISYNSQNPTAAVVTNATTLTLTFPIATGTSKSGGSLVLAASTVQDAASADNLEITIVNGSITDSAKPVATSATFYDATSNDGKLDLITVVWSENLSATADGSGDWAISSAANFTALVEGSVVCNSGAAAANECDYNFTTTAVKTNVGDLTLTYTAGTSVTDGTNTANTIALSSGSSPAFTDGAKPVLVSAAMGTTSDQNNLVMVYSEPMFVNLNPGVNTSIDDGTDIDGTADDDTTTSTANFGNIDAAGSIETFGNFSAAGTVTQSAAVNNTVDVASGGLTVTITFNSVAKSYFTNSATAPSGTFTPDGDTTNYVLAQASGAIADRRVNTNTGRTVTGSWDLTGPSTPVSFAKQEAVSDTSDKFTWSSVGNADFEEYIVFYSTGAVTLISGASEWTRTNHAALATRTTEATTITGLTTDTSYFYRIGAIDKAGNVSLSSQINETAGEDLGGGNDAIDNTAPSAPTGVAASVNSEFDVVLTWVDPTASDLKEVQIQRSVDGGSFVTLALVNKGAKTYLDTNVEKGKKYTYRLYANDLVGNKSVASSDIEITVAEGATATVEDTKVVEDTEESEDKNDTPVEEDEAAEETDTTVAVELKDVATHWATDEITAMVEMEVVKGNPDGSFKPDNALNRAEAATLLFRVLGMDEEEMSAPEEKPFSDVAVDSWYAIYVDTLKGLEVVKGNPDGTYAPGKNINRAEFLTLAMNAYYYMMAEEMGDVTVTDAFSDLDKNAWYAKTVSAAFEMKFVSDSACGEKKCFNANSNITRAEATVMLYNIFYKDMETEEDEEEVAAEPVVVNLTAQNTSGESGTATFTEVDGKVKVVLALTGAPKDVEQPAHIHMGSCATPGDVKYALTSPKNGASETMLDVSWAKLVEGLPLMVNVHKSAAESSIYYACGDIK